MAYQKSKHVEAAQKYLHQGKVAQAIAEYQAILKHEPKDQITLMTVGDLFVRQGETFLALEYFERLAQIYLADGFLTKAIAIYKKITKLAPEEMRPVERLADLYVQQGVMSEARPIYLQMAEMHQRANRPAQAVSLLRKLLEAEPDNTRVQSRLADLLASSGQSAEAANVFRAAAQQLVRRGDHAEALKFADRALKIDPNDASAMTLRARALVGDGKQNEAVSMLESLSEVDAGGETSTLLVDLYLDAGEMPRASELAERIFVRDAQRYAVVQHVAAALLDRGEGEHALPLLERIRSSVLAAGEHERLSELLARVAEALPGRIEPLASLVDVYKHTSDSFRLPDALIHLAEAYEAAGQMELALRTYLEFLQREPENDAIRRKREQLQAQLGQPGAAVTPAVVQPQDPAQAAEPPAAPPAPEENLDNETQLFVAQAITDVDLYSSYGLTQKALELLEVVLQRAPDHPPALERLLDLSVGMNEDARAVELASRLERLYAECGNREAADRFADLRRRFERVASAAAPEDAPQTVQEAAPPPTAPVTPTKPAALSTPVEFEIPEVDAHPDEAADLFADSAVSDSVVHEVDLSEEWAALSADPVEATPVAKDAGVTDAYDGLISSLQGEVSAESSPVDEEPASVGAETVIETPPARDAAKDATEKAPLLLDVATDPLLQELLDEYEKALAVEDAAAHASDADSNQDLSVLSAELDATLPGLIDSAAEMPRTPVESAKAGASQTLASQGPLGDVFDEFRADLDEGSEREDPETHYNLGIAYREMGLMDEAISEFQKVASAHQKGQPFRYALQCYTLLALAFAEKGQPSIAVSWYERALQVPGLDPETVLALRYDLGVSQEMAGDVQAAHKSFAQVYGTNIDYRDVAERLAALGGRR